MILVLLIIVLLVGAVLCALAARVDRSAVRWTALIATMIDVALSFGLVCAVQAGPVTLRLPWLPTWGASFHLEADGLAALMVVLTTVLGVVAVLISWEEIEKRSGAFHVWLLLLQVGILIVFMARDALLFYFGWELMLIPLFFIIGIWGHEDKQRAAFKFLLFTFGGSIFMLAALLYVYARHINLGLGVSFAIDDLMKTPLSAAEQWWVFLGLIVGFAVKIPLFPVHTWLPDAHTQAPTAGSLILAGVLLKTGVYGLIRLAIPLAPFAAEAFAPLVIALSLIGIYYGAVVAFAQRDFKRLVAYSSISHLGFVVLGLFLGNAAGYQGAVLQMVNHGLATGGLFLLAGIIQHRAHTRNLDVFGGLWKFAPAMGAFLLFFAFASLGIPGTGNFVGELYVIAGTFQFHHLLGALTALAVLFAAAYSLKLFLATMHGPTVRPWRAFEDLHIHEVLALGILCVGLIAIGLYPRIVTAPLYFPPDSLVPKSGRQPERVLRLEASRSTGEDWQAFLAANQNMTKDVALVSE
ncbi:MAG: complex I subunit 4 family protein, partial [Candidatus Sumerlaeaceae bacterium]